MKMKVQKSGSNCDKGSIGQLSPETKTYGGGSTAVGFSSNHSLFGS